MHLTRKINVVYMKCITYTKTYAVYIKYDANMSPVFFFNIMDSIN